APLRFKHRHLPRAEAGHPAFAIPSYGSDRADEGATHQSDHCRAFSRSQDRGKSCERDRCESYRLFAIPGRPARNGQLREAHRYPHLAASRGAEMKSNLVAVRNRSESDWSLECRIIGFKNGWLEVA